MQDTENFRAVNNQFKFMFWIKNKKKKYNHVHGLVMHYTETAPITFILLMDASSSRNGVNKQSHITNEPILAVSNILISVKINYNLMLNVPKRVKLFLLIS